MPLFSLITASAAWACVLSGVLFFGLMLRRGRREWPSVPLFYLSVDGWFHKTIIKFFSPQGGFRSMECVHDLLEVTSLDNWFCNRCGESSKGRRDDRYRCGVCKDFDLCGKCRTDHLHPLKLVTYLDARWFCDKCKRWNPAGGRFRCHSCRDFDLCIVCYQGHRAACRERQLWQQILNENAANLSSVPRPVAAVQPEENKFEPPEAPPPSHSESLASGAAPHSLEGTWRDLQAEYLEELEGMSLSDGQDLLAVLQHGHTPGSSDQSCATVSLAYLAAATNDFAKDRVIGEGAFGTVFLGIDPRNAHFRFAVKRLNRVLPEAVRAARRTVRNEVNALSSIRHPNVIRLLGVSEQAAGGASEAGEGKEEERKEAGQQQADEVPTCLVLEHGARGSLDAALRDEQTARELSPAVRLNIAAALARALAYLHLGHKPAIFHLDVKSANVVLTHSLQPKLIDCGLARIVQEAENSQPQRARVTTMTAMPLGTAGYVCPTFLRRKQPSSQTEAYAYGMVLLELLTGRIQADADVDLFEEMGADDFDRCRPSEADERKAILDEALLRLDSRCSQWPEWSRELLAISLDCLRRCKDRPSMGVVVRRVAALNNRCGSLSCDEAMLRERLAGLEEQMADHQANEARQAAAEARRPKVACLVCFEQCPSDEGVACTGNSMHFICDECFADYVAERCSEDRNTNEVVALHGGLVPCPLAAPMGQCDSRPFDQVAVLQHCTGNRAAILAYLDKREFLARVQAETEVIELARQQTEEQVRAAVTEARRAAQQVFRSEQQQQQQQQRRQVNLLEARMLQRQFPNAKQCGQCGYGPVLHAYCADLQSHQGQRMSQVGGRRGQLEQPINNACPRCNWFVATIDQWPPWNGRLPRQED